LKTEQTDGLVVKLNRVDKDDLTIAGGKGANLGELIRAGFPVPAGFVVTTTAYDHFVSHNALEQTIGQMLKTKQLDSDTIRTAFESGTIPLPIEQNILTAFAQLGQCPVAVRSSATAEDLPGAAFAGQQDTFLNIVGTQAVLDAVRRCWASLWTERAIAYRERQGLDQRAVKIAVVVQCMVAADVAGVMFTANPVTGVRQEIIVDANPGLGEAVVSGQVTPDHYVLQKQRWGWRIKERRAGRQEIIIRAQAGGGTEQRQGNDAANNLVLSNKAIGELARLGTAIEQHFGSPQDIEWALSEGKLAVLQARPMTALPEPTSPLPGPQRLLGNLIGELLPTRPYPFDVSVWIPALFSLISRVFGIIGLKTAPFEAMFAGADGISLRPPTELAVHPTPAMILFPFRVLWLTVRYKSTRWRDDSLFTKAQAQVNTLEELDLSALSWKELVIALRQALTIPAMLGEIRRRYFPRAALAAGLIYIVLKLLRRSDKFAPLISGNDSETLATNRALETLAAQIRSDTALSNIFTQNEPQQIWKVLDTLPSGQAFRTKFEDFLNRYGHRETALLLASQPTWKDAPEIVLGLLKGFAQAPPQAQTSQQQIWEKARNHVLNHPILRLPPMRSTFLSLLIQAHALLTLREDTHFYGTLSMPVVRRIAIQMGQRLVKIGVMKEPEELFHLTWYELNILNKTWPPSVQLVDEIRALVVERQEKRVALAHIPYRIPGLARQGSIRNALLTGMSGSPGVIEGSVCIIREPSEFNKLRSGDVLVAPYTNPAWTPLFQTASAVVVDTGGLASHAAIVAREYGIPAVMGTIDGTQRLIDGQHVRVDGNQGCVFLASPMNEHS
jgi:rifampicin phosphotransferase